MNSKMIVSFCTKQLGFEEFRIAGWIKHLGNGEDLILYPVDDAGDVESDRSMPTGLVLELRDNEKILQRMETFFDVSSDHSDLITIVGLLFEGCTQAEQRERERERETILRQIEWLECFTIIWDQDGENNLKGLNHVYEDWLSKEKLNEYDHGDAVELRLLLIEKRDEL
jgi:hypothetical protein